VLSTLVTSFYLLTNPESFSLLLPFFVLPAAETALEFITDLALLLKPLYFCTVDDLGAPAVGAF